MRTSPRPRHEELNFTRVDTEHLGYVRVTSLTIIGGELPASGAATTNLLLKPLNFSADLRTEYLVWRDGGFLRLSCHSLFTLRH